MARTPFQILNIDHISTSNKILHVNHAIFGFQTKLRLLKELERLLFKDIMQIEAQFLWSAMGVKKKSYKILKTKNNRNLTNILTVG